MNQTKTDIKKIKQSLKEFFEYEMNEEMDKFEKIATEVSKEINDELRVCIKAA